MREPILTLDKYEILEAVGSGGMATVYRGRATGPMGFEKAVAVKVLQDDAADDDELVRMFIDEAKLGARLTHPNIATVLDFGESGGRYWLTMEYVDGPSLATLLKGSGRSGRTRKGPVLAPTAAAWVTAGVLRALAFAHGLTGGDGKAMSVVHRDVSPHNVLLDRGGQVRLADFGIATGAYRSEKTRAGVIKGKAGYMAPEQASGGKVDARSDLYAAGLTLFAMLAGAGPFTGDDTGAVRAAAAKGLDRKTIDALPCDDALKAVLHQALARKPSDRFATADAFLEALAEAVPGYEAAGRTALIEAVRRSTSPARARPKRGAAAAATKARSPATTSHGSLTGLRTVVILAAVLLLAAVGLALLGVGLPD
jgi:serine/threonine-protein kinase